MNEEAKEKEQGLESFTHFMFNDEAKSEPETGIKIEDKKTPNVHVHSEYYRTSNVSHNSCALVKK